MNAEIIPAQQGALAMPRQAESDATVIQMWIHSRSPHTKEAYLRDVARLNAFTAGRPLATITLGDLQAFQESLSDLAPASSKRVVSAIKSLLSFGQKIGYLHFNVGKAVVVPAAENTLAERIMSEGDVQRMLALEPNQRNRVLLSILYYGGLRVSEACGMRWRNVQPRERGGQLAVFGKGRKTRVILLPADIFLAILALRGEAGVDDPVFRSRKGGKPLSRVQAMRVVQAAARRAGIAGAVSPHWLRHAHATHALNRGAPIHLVADTLGHASVATTGMYAHANPTESSARYLPQ